MVVRPRTAVEVREDWQEALAREIVDYLVARPYGRITDYYSEVAKIIEKRGRDRDLAGG